MTIDLKSILLCAAVVFSAQAATDPSELRVLFLGDSGHHRPAERFKEIQPVLAAKQIELTYTEALADLQPAMLAGFDSIAIYANHTAISSGQEAALLNFVAEGGGLVAIHCASFCFHNSDKYIELVGAQFKSHGTGVFKETIVQAHHPVMQELQPIESWDESYVHARHNADRTVLAERRDANGAEPYTWVREHGQGRVFYTAWGHDERTWGNPNFQKLLENGIRWASANSPAHLKVIPDLPPFDYVPSDPLPNYIASERWGTQGDVIRVMQKPLPPAESLQHLAVFPEFEKSLFASEPDIVKPIWLSWDERGRLWIAETIDYPNEMQPPGQGRDRLKICEDTDGDGRADKFTVFADRLSVPTSFVFANGGVIVIHSGKTEFLRDTNGDDKADERKDLFTGWGTNDTHAGPSNLRYGFDGWIWGTVGYSGFRGTVGGKEIRFGQGIFRFRTDGSELEFIRSSNNNTWGLGLNEEGVVFGSTANGNASMYLPIPNRYYERVNGWSSARLESIADSQRFFPITEKVRQVDWHGKYTAGAGSAIYTARSFPKEYWNRAQFVTEPTGHLIGLFYLVQRGADYIAHNARNFAASNDEWTSPIAAEVGPDGALWVLDWYNYIIQHNPTPQGFSNGRGNAYETPLRDKVHGRIQRIAYKNAKPSKPMGKDWVEGLKSDNLLWRLHAQRLIIEGRKKEAIPALLKLLEDQSVDELGLNPAAIHALWALEGLAANESSSAATAAIKHRSAGVRRSAVTLLPRDSSGTAAIVDGNLLADSDPQVRLAAFLALSEMPPSEKAGRAILQALQDPQNSEDRWIGDAATAAAARHDSAFLKEVLAAFKPQPASTPSSDPGNLIRNSSFAETDGKRPAGWRTVTHGGRADFGLAESGRTDSRSVKITSDRGADASWAVRVAVKPRTEYRLSGWIKTEGVRALGNACGALFNVHEMQDAIRGATKPVVGDQDWTRAELNFNSGEMSEITINALFGGWGRATGTAYFDDVELRVAPGAELGGELGRIVRLVTRHYAQRGPTDSIFATLRGLRDASSDLSAVFLDGLVAGWPEDKVPSVSADQRTEMKTLMQSLPESTRDRLLALSMKWGKTDLFSDNIDQIIARLREEISNGNSSAAKRLVTLADSAETTRAILAPLTLLTPPDEAKALLNALAESRDTNTGREIVSKWSNLGPAARRSAAALLMRRTEWAAALLSAVEENQIPKADLAAEHWSQLKQNPNRMISRRADRLAGQTSVSADRQEIVEKLLPLARERGGDIKLGREVYATSCAVCHVFNGEGGKVGPDLSGVGAKPAAEILTDILDPNRSVEANYQMWSVTTKDDETFSGRLETETQTTVEILDTTGQKHVLQRKDIQSMQSSALSIMPAGFEALPPDQIKALLAFLTSAPHGTAAP